MIRKKGNMSWERAMAIARRHHPNFSLKRRRKVAAAIMIKWYL